MVESLRSSRCRFPFLRRLAIVLAGSLSATHGFAVTTTPSWKFPLVVGPTNQLLQQGDRFFAYDNLGTPNVVTTNGSSVTLFRQVPGLGWRSRIVATSVKGDANGVSIAIDRREQPAIGYGDAGGLHYVSWDPVAGAFVDSIVNDSSVSSRQFSGGTAVAFDLMGRPAIAAVDVHVSTTEVIFVTDTNLDGVLSAADSLEIASTFPDRRPSLVFDHNNRAVIAGNDGGFIDVAVRDRFVGWSTTTIAGGLGSSPNPVSVANGSVAIDPDDGMPAVAWTNQNTRELFYAKWDPINNGWFAESVATAAPGLHLSNESLAFDPGDGHPAISYSDDLGRLFFAWHDGVAWNSHTVYDSSLDVPLRTSLDFDHYGHGYPAIAFIDGGGTVAFTVDPPLGAVPEPGAAALALLSAALGAGLRRRRVSAPAACR